MHRFGVLVPATKTTVETGYGRPLPPSWPEIEVFIVAGGNFPTLSFISDWERGIGRPVITSNQAALWAMIRIMRAGETLPGLGRLLEQMPVM